VVTSAPTSTIGSGAVWIAVEKFDVSIFIDAMG
jgi:hypothetical protein